MSLGLISHPDCLLHEMGHAIPEVPARIKVIDDALKRSALKNIIKEFTAPKATRADLIRAHEAHYIDFIFNKAPREGLVELDPDTWMNPNTLNAALYAAGAVILAVDLVMSRQIQSAFCNIRPPGHHAEKDKAMGFCFFNNVAVGAAYALERYGVNRIAIIDFDVHHGNGTEDIFKNNDKILYCSSFEYPLYPFNSVHEPPLTATDVPLPAQCDSELFRQKLTEHWFAPIAQFKPELVFFSAGFDGYFKDNIANLSLTVEDYAWITQQILALTHESSHNRVVSVLEGGYALEGLGQCAVSHVQEIAKMCIPVNS